MKKRLFSVILAALMLAASGSLFACSDSTTNSDPSTDNTEPSAVEEVVEETEPETEVIKPDLPADLKFTGSTFTFGVVDNANARNFLVMEELTAKPSTMRSSPSSKTRRNSLTSPSHSTSSRPATRRRAV